MNWIGDTRRALFLHHRLLYNYIIIHRIILDLSSPAGSSVNDGIPRESFTVRYSEFDEAVSLVLSFGRGWYMAKVDVKHAFRLCPGHPSDWPLLGFSWLGRFFFDTRLPFGSRSSPFIFNALAGFWGYCITIDFFVVAVSRAECQEKVDVILNLFSAIGVSVAEQRGTNR